VAHSVFVGAAVVTVLFSPRAGEPATGLSSGASSSGAQGRQYLVTVHELRLESFFPADEASADWFRQRAAG
jgi:hypothetical protein